MLKILSSVLSDNSQEAELLDHMVVFYSFKDAPYYFP